MGHPSIHLQRRECSEETKNHTRRIGQHQGEIALLFKQTVAHPQRAIDTCHKGLDERTLVAIEVFLYLWKIKHIHQDGSTHTDPTYITKKFFFIHLSSSMIEHAKVDFSPQKTGKILF